MKFEYKKCGKVLGVAIYGEGEDRHAIVTFSQPEEAEKALTAFQDKLFYGSRLIAIPTEEEGMYSFKVVCISYVTLKKHQVHCMV